MDLQHLGRYAMRVNIDVSEYTEADEIADRAWHQGYRGFVSGRFRRENPYGTEIKGFDQWAAGWLAAEKNDKAMR